MLCCCPRFRLSAGQLTDLSVTQSACIATAVWDYEGGPVRLSKEVRIVIGHHVIVINSNYPTRFSHPASGATPCKTAFCSRRTTISRRSLPSAPVQGLMKLSETCTDVSEARSKGSSMHMGDCRSKYRLTQRGCEDTGWSCTYKSSPPYHLTYTSCTTLLIISSPTIISPICRPQL